MLEYFTKLCHVKSCHVMMSSRCSSPTKDGREFGQHVCKDLRDFNKFIMDQEFEPMDLSVLEDVVDSEVEDDAEMMPRSPDLTDGAEATEMKSVFLDASGKVDMNDFLPTLARWYLQKVKDSLEFPSIALPDKMTLCSLCAGSGLGEIVFEVAVNEISDYFMQPLRRAE